MTNSGKLKVFLSHSSNDKPFVRDLDRALQAYGIESFLDERDIGIGEDIPHRLFNEIYAATHVCYVISRSSITSEWVRDELSKASMLEKERKGVFVLPILIEQVEIPIAVKNKRYADFTIDATKPIHEQAAFTLLLTAMGVDPARFEPQSFPSKQLLLDFAEATTHLIQCLIDIRIRASQIRDEWTTSRYLDVNVYYRLTYDRTIDLRRRIDAYETAREQLQPYVANINSSIDVSTVTEELFHFFDSAIGIPSDPRRLIDVPQQMATLSSRTNAIELMVSAMLTSLLFLLSKESVEVKRAG
ncbi:MAG: toll/interleukin-1 receptor domain-containing protein [Pseudomonadota bacterium]|jgi:hypothetical protein